MNVGLFVAGAIVTLIVALAVGLIVYGIVLDGRYLRQRQAEQDRLEEAQASRKAPV